MATRIIMGLGTLVAVAVAAAACGSSGGTGGTGGATTTQTTSSQSSSGAGGSNACGTLAWSSTNASCSACMDAGCCDELVACDTGTACGTLIKCIRACGPSDPSCVTDCQATHADGQATVDALLGCFDAHCKNNTACGTKVCDTGISVQGQVCGDCLTTSCCDSWKLCSQDDMCLSCLLNPTAACDGSTLYLDAVGCQDTSCGPTCATRICDTGLGYPDAPACNYCLGQKDALGGCCEETEACSADDTCHKCITGAMTTGCSMNAAYTAFTTCQQKCAAQCGG